MIFAHVKVEDVTVNLLDVEDSSTLTQSIDPFPGLAFYRRSDLLFGP